MLKIEPLPQNYAELIFESFGEEPRCGSSCSFVSTETSWLIFEPMGKIAYIHYAATRNQYRQKGYATEGFALAIEALAHAGFKQLQLTTKVDNVSPQILALKNGFTVMAALNGPKNDFQIIWRKNLTTGS